MSDDDDLLNLPECIMRCTECGHEPVECWMRDVGCNHCVGEAILDRVARLSWEDVPKEELS